MIRVFLADDHEIVLGGLQKLLAESGDICVVGTATDGRRALQRTLEEDLEWDVLILDLSLPRVGGIEVLRRVTEARPAARVLVLSMYPEEQYALQLIHAGAAAYLSKASPPEALLDAIRRVAAGHTSVSPAVERKLRLRIPDEEKLPHMKLSSREHQVFSLLIEGNSVTDIASQLDLTPSTVSNHLRGIKDKLEAPTVSAIMRYAHRAGLVD